MKIDRQTDLILHDHLLAIANGEETLESVVAKFPRIAEELRPRLEAALWLQQARFALATRPGFIHDSRKYIETKIESMQPRNTWQRVFNRFSPQRWIFNVAAPVIIFLLLALVTNSAVLTARLAIPGEPLYSTKLVIEDLQLALSFNQVNRTNLTIEFSRERALEFVELVLEGEYDYLPEAATRMEREIIASLHSLDRIGAEEPSIERSMASSFREALDSEIQMLNVLKSTSPHTAYGGIELAINVSQSGIFALR